ncbi:hypothetical protein OsI_24524 [Oryza sativa Indica Group]|uniref:RING-type E3 ubiquitin transferase n=1 Tax=Oryza sativa subsp. indica TaxID=39946 RepID=A2YH62_ORYSI|nr:hypothetical protein OsI_24524 [Oryza sativa Indica Group]
MGAAVAEAEPSGRQLSDGDLLEELLSTANAARAFHEFRQSQRKECFNLLRWLQLLLPLVQELRESAPALSDDAYRRLALLGRAFQAARRLLRGVYEKMNMALEGMPYAELGVSDEVKEQVELISAQLKKRSKKRTETQDMELAMDLMMILQSKEQDANNADRPILDRLAKRLQLQSLADLRAETMAIKKLINDHQSDSTNQIVDLLHRLKAIAGVDEKNILGDVFIPKYLEKCPSLMIPNDFLCPISLEIMTDPTYERRSIQKWLDAGQRTCPKTQQPLGHLSLAPNYALKNLIMQWCDKNKVEIHSGDPPPEPPEDPKVVIPTLVKDLSSPNLDVQRKAVKKIRTLSKENPENRLLVTDNAGIPALIGLLPYPDKKMQENTVTSLLNLSIDEANKLLIARGGAIPLIIDVLRNGSVEGQENSAAALFSLSMVDENKVAIGTLGGIPPLVDLLQNGTVRGKKDASTAIFNLMLNNGNKLRAIEAGILPTLLKLLDDKKAAMVDEALSIFLLLASNPTCRGEVGTEHFVEKLVQIIKEGTPKNKECAVSVLLELGSSNNALMAHALGFDLHDHLADIAKNGTSRAQRKANSLIQLARKCS